VVAGDDPCHLGGDDVGVGLALDREVELVVALPDLDTDRRLEVPVDPEGHPHHAVEGPLVAVAEPEQRKLLEARRETVSSVRRVRRRRPAEPPCLYLSLGRTRSR
jgi:hypothetical protein